MGMVKIPRPMRAKPPGPITATTLEVMRTTYDHHTCQELLSDVDGIDCRFTKPVTPPSIKSTNISVSLTWFYSKLD
jgi:hypothetical protein